MFRSFIFTCALLGSIPAAMAGDVPVDNFRGILAASQTDFGDTIGSEKTIIHFGCTNSPVGDADVCVDTVAEVKRPDMRLYADVILHPKFAYHHRSIIRTMTVTNKQGAWGWRTVVLFRNTPMFLNVTCGPTYTLAARSDDGGNTWSKPVRRDANGPCDGLSTN